jgi:DNA (cytosine-5)-methyltransferase 1
MTARSGGRRPSSKSGWEKARGGFDLEMRTGTPEPRYGTSVMFEPGEVRVAEFFAGVGLARIALELTGMTVVWSNDIDSSKRAMYQNHFGHGIGHEYRLDDVANVRSTELPRDLSLAWASFPCTDLSLAGGRAGLDGDKSGTFFGFTRCLGEMVASDRPPVVALENVPGLATSRGGEDLRTAVRTLNDLGYSVDVIVLDARRFVPQSRSRLFLVGAMNAPEGESGISPLRPRCLDFIFHDRLLRTHAAPLPSPPSPLVGGFSDLVDRLVDDDEAWWSGERRGAFFASLSDLQEERLAALAALDDTAYRTAYRRTREGRPVWEIRGDDLSGCLRTARGGSSKQAVVRVGGGRPRAVRWMTAREYGALMGASSYNLTGIRPLQAMFGFGDAVCVPAVEWIARHYLSNLVPRKSLSLA